VLDGVHAIRQFGNLSLIGIAEERTGRNQQNHE
jgi:hypothetical protein